jgi:hypothetical protein
LTFAQQPEQIINGEFQLVKSDYLGNIYTLTANNALEKRNSQGKIICTYNDKSKGVITDFDVSNPMRVLAFQGDFSNVSILDNTLSATSTLDFSSFGFNTELKFASSFDNGFWIFDNASYTLSKYNASLTRTFESGNLTQSLGYKIIPVQIMESGNYIFINTTESGLLLFDIYGNFVKKINDKISRIRSLKDFIYYKKNGELCTIDTRTGISECKDNGYNLGIIDIIVTGTTEIQHLKDKLILRKQTF